MFKFTLKLFLYGLIVCFMELLVHQNFENGLFIYIFEKIGQSFGLIIFSSIISIIIYYGFLYWRIRRFDIEVYKKNITYVWTFFAFITILNYIFVK